MIKKRLAAIGACASMLFTSVGGMATAFAADSDVPYIDDTTSYAQSLTVDTSVSDYNWTDVNKNKLIDAGDTIDATLNIKNDSNKDYTYVDISSHKLDMKREFVSDSLPAGQTIHKNINYTLTEEDTIANQADATIYVNVRDNSLLEGTTTADFNVIAGGASAYTASDCSVIDESSEFIQGCFKQLEDYSWSNNSEIASGNVIFDKETQQYIVQNGDKAYGEIVKKATGKDYIVLKKNQLLSDYATVGDQYLTFIKYLNTDQKTTFTGIEHVKGSIVDDNIVGTTVRKNITGNLYFAREITQDDMDWGLNNSMTGLADDSLKYVLKDTDGTNWVVDGGYSPDSSKIGIMNSIEGKSTENKDGSNDVVFTYNVSRTTNNASAILRGIVSKKHGFFSIDELANDNEVRTVDMPTVNVKPGKTANEEGYVIYYGKYYSSLAAGVMTAMVENSRIAPPVVEKPDYKEPTFTPAECSAPVDVDGTTVNIDQPAKLNTPENTDYYEYSSTEDTEKGLITVSVKDKETGDVLKTWDYDTNAPTDCDEPVVEKPDYKEPTFVPAECFAPTNIDGAIFTAQKPALFSVPKDTKYYDYSYTNNDKTGVLKISVKDKETGKVLKTWKYDTNVPTDCEKAPVVEKPDYKKPTFQLATCWGDAGVKVPNNDDNYTYEYSRKMSSKLEGTDTVKVLDKSSGKVVDIFKKSFKNLTAADCSEPKKADPKPVVKVDPPKKINSGELSEVVSDNKNYNIAALVMVAGLVLAITTSGAVVVVRNKK